MKKILGLAGAALLIPVLAQAQNPQLDARRNQLQGQIVERFMNHVATQLELDQATRGKLHAQMRQSGEARRKLAENSADLRIKMLAATRDSTTTDAMYRKLLNDMTALRQREENLWSEDQDALSRILTPRQHVQFVFMWLRFQDQIREMALRPPPGMMPGEGFGPPRPRRP